MVMHVVVQFHARSGCEEALREGLMAVIEPTRSEPGCVEIRLLRALRDPDTFFIQSVWSAEEEFEKHAALPHMKVFLARVPEWIDHDVRAKCCARLA